MVQITGKSKGNFKNVRPWFGHFYGKYNSDQFGIRTCWFYCWKTKISKFHEFQISEPWEPSFIDLTIPKYLKWETNGRTTSTKLLLFSDFAWFRFHDFPYSNPQIPDPEDPKNPKIMQIDVFVFSQNKIEKWLVQNEAE